MITFWKQMHLQIPHEKRRVNTIIKSNQVQILDISLQLHQNTKTIQPYRRRQSWINHPTSSKANRNGHSDSQSSKSNALQLHHHESQSHTITSTIRERYLCLNWEPERIFCRVAAEDMFAANFVVFHFIMITFIG